MADSPSLLIVANSGRMLAQAALKADFKALVIDLYGDQDTALAAKDLYPISSLEQKNMLPAVERMVSRHGVSAAIYGAGFEPHQESLKLLSEKLTLYGNNPDIFAAVNDKPNFFSVLKKLHMPFPDVSLTKPTKPNGWLFKPLVGTGGVGIHLYNGLLIDKLGYWQRFQTGQAQSVLFLADGRQAGIIGFNRQWTTKLNDQNEFVFCRIINHAELTGQQRQTLSAWAGKLTALYELKGLNSLDYIRHGTELHVLEINPRPPASMQLYGLDLLALHIEACCGRLPEVIPCSPRIGGYQILYARQPVRIPENFSWPDGAADIPAPGAVINTQEPICSIIARQNSPELVLQQLNQTQNFILNQLARSQIHGIQR